MIYRVLVDITIIIHFLWILFLIFGILFAIRGSKIAFLHISGLIFSLIINIFGWYCPLTHLENYFYKTSLSGTYYNGSFISYYLNRIIYLDVPLSYIRIGGIIFVIINTVVYIYLFKKYHLFNVFLKKVNDHY